VDPSAFEQRVAANLPPELAGRRVLAAVSGGADSVCLLRVLHALRGPLQLELFAAHFNHGWRGADSDADAAFVRDLCDMLEIELFSDAALLSEDSESRLNAGSRLNEEGARDKRYEFFDRVATDNQCGFVAVAHTADDQVETVLHHILRGTGLAGLRGMPLERDFDCARLIRPLLTVRRAEVEAYLAAIGQPFRTDATNADERFTRNRIRRVLLPLLREQFNPQVDDALLRLADQARDATRVLHAVAGELLDESLLELTPAVCRLRRDALIEADPELVRTALMLLWKRAGWPRRKMCRDDWRRAAELVVRDGAMTLPGGIQVRSRGGVVVFQPKFDGG
jgi:tRNA(Ile)-lysidine synthase